MYFAKKAFLRVSLIKVNEDWDRQSKIAKGLVKLYYSGHSASLVLISLLDKNLGHFFHS